MQIPYVYIFDWDDGSLECHSSLTFEKLIFGEGTIDRSLHFFAINNLKKIRIEISERPATVLKLEDRHQYSVWLEREDSSTALQLIYMNMLEEVDDICKQYSDVVDELKARLDSIENLMNNTSTGIDI